MSEGKAPQNNPGGVDWESSPDLTAVPGESLGSMLEELVEQEREISYRRRIIQGRIDLIRSELLRRGSNEVSTEELARILMDRNPGP